MVGLRHVSKQYLYIYIYIRFDQLSSTSVHQVSFCLIYYTARWKYLASFMRMCSNRVKVLNCTFPSSKFFDAPNMEKFKISAYFGAFSAFKCLCLNRISQKRKFSVSSNVFILLILIYFRHKFLIRLCDFTDRSYINDLQLHILCLVI